jgi:predicted PurR-regulated permease PerM
MFNSKGQKQLFFWTIELLALGALLLVISRLTLIIEPIQIFISTVFLPLVIAGFFYYILNPVVELLMRLDFGKFRLTRKPAVVITFLAAILVVAGGLVSFIPTLIEQVVNLVSALPGVVDNLRPTIERIVESEAVSQLNVDKQFDSLQSDISSYITGFLTGTAGTISSLISTVTSVTINAVTIPVILFYMLMDGPRLGPAIYRVVNGEHRPKVRELLGKMHVTIQNYIAGQAIEVMFVGVGMAIGFLLIDLPSALLLGVIAGITNMIPYIGPWIGMLPALFIALSEGVEKAILVIVVVVIVQQIDGNILYPKVIGNKLHIHPLTIIILLLAAGNIWGIAGMILAVPIYAVVRTVVQYGWQLRQITRQQKL